MPLTKGTMSSDGSGSSPTHSQERFARAAPSRRSLKGEVRKGACIITVGYAWPGYVPVVVIFSEEPVPKMHLRDARAFAVIAATSLLLPLVAACQPAAPAAPTTAAAPTSAPAKPTTAAAASP